MANFWNNIWPVSVNLPQAHGSNITQPPLNAPLPNHILPPGFTPNLPQAVIPSNPGNVKALLNKLPNLFNINHG